MWKIINSKLSKNKINRGYQPINMYNSMQVYLPAKIFCLVNKEVCILLKVHVLPQILLSLLKFLFQVCHFFF